jgi:hypothetical protein
MLYCQTNSIPGARNVSSICCPRENYAKRFVVVLMMIIGLENSERHSLAASPYIKH